MASVFSSGAGSLSSSTFPLEVSGISSRRITQEGIMYFGSREAANASSSTSGISSGAQ